MAEQQAGSVLETRTAREETVTLARMHDIRDIKVRNPEGENLGDISDVAIDHGSGCITYAVLSYGGILGFGEKHFAIPWEAVRMHPGEKSATVDTDKQTLDNSTGFSRDMMPNEADWSLIRTPHPAHTTAVPTAPAAKSEVSPTPRAEEIPEPAETTGRERIIPTPPPVQTVAGGWGEQPTTKHVEKREMTAKTTPISPPGVREVHRERIPKTSPHETADLQVYLRGLDYPAGKQDLIDHARKNNAPESLVTIIERFSDRKYQSAGDVNTEAEKIR